MSMLRRRLHALGVLVLVAGLFGGAVWIYVVLLQTSFGVLSWDAVREADARRGRVALLDSDYTAQVNRARAVEGLGVDADWLAATVRDWRAYLLNRQIPYSEVTDADLEAGALADYDILVLPAAQALSDAQLDQIKAFLRAGKGVLATWTPGVYRPDGSWRGHAFLSEIAGAQFEGFIEPGGSGYRVSRDTIPGTVPAGLYRPDYAVDARALTPEQVAQNARAEGVPALGGFTWLGALDMPRPAAAFALAEPVGPDLVSEAAARTAVAYYTWLGGDPTAADALAATFRRFTLRGGTPLTAGLPAGTQLRAGSFDAPVRARSVEARAQVAGEWYDYTADDRLPSEARAASAGLLYGRFAAGRFVFLGHELAAMGVGPDDQRVIARLFDNTFAWLARRPLGWLGDWPAPYRAAAVIAGSADTDPGGLEALRAALEPRGLPATYFLAAGPAKAYADLYRRLDAHGEVALLGPRRAEALTTEALRAERALLAETVTLADGARLGHTALEVPGAEAYAAYAESGFAYVAVDSVASRATPAILVTGDDGRKLVRLPRTSRSPQATLRRLPDADLQARYAREDAARVIDTGGLAMLTFSGDDLRRPGMRAMLDASVEAVVSDGAVWVTTAGAVADWWRVRDRLTLDVQDAGPRRVTVRVANDGRAVARDVGVTVALGQLAAGIEVTPELVGTPTPEATLAGDGETVRLTVATLAPGASQTVHIDIEPAGLLAGR